MAVRGLDLRAQVDGFRVYRVPDGTQYGFSPASTVSEDPSNAVVDDCEAKPHRLSVIEAADGAPAGA